MFTVACIVVLGASQASAQEPSRWITGQTGFTTGTSAWLLGGEAGARVNPIVGIYGSFGRMADAAPNGLNDALTAAGSAVAVTMPTLYGVGGVKLYAPGNRVKPYGLGGLGFARMTAKYTVSG